MINNIYYMAISSLVLLVLLVLLLLTISNIKLYKHT